MIHVNRASLSIFSETRTAEEITAALDLEPTGPRTRADFDPHRHARWTLYLTDDPRESGDRTGFGSIRQLVEILLPKRDALRNLKLDSDLRFGWSGDSDSSQGGFVLSAELLSALGDLGIDLYGTAFLDCGGTNEN